MRDSPLSPTVLRSMTSWLLTIAVAAPSAVCQAPKKTAAVVPASTSTLDRVRATGRIRLGYRTDAAPLSSQDESGKAAGFSVDLCRSIAEAVKNELQISVLTVEWVPLTASTRLTAVQQGQIDLLCGAESVTLERRKSVSFSEPIFPGGVGALVRADAPAQLKEILAGKRSTRPNWRAVALQVLRDQTFAAVPGTTADQWTSQRRAELKLESTLLPVPDYAAGIQAVLDRRANAFFGDRAILEDAAQRNRSGGGLVVIDRLFTNEPVALALQRGDEEFRLLVDRTLSQLLTSPAFPGMYKKWFGNADDAALAFYRWNTLPE